MNRSAAQWRPAAGDDVGAPTPLGDLVEGMELPRWRRTITASTAQRLRTAIGRSFTPNEAVTPALAGNLCVGMFFRVLPRNVVHVAQSIETLGAVHVGDEVEVRMRLGRIGRRGRRAFVEFAGEIAVAGDIVWRVAATASPPAVDPEVVESLPELEPIVRPIAGAPVVTQTHQLTIEGLTAFSGPGNFHSEFDIARRFGYRAPIAQGMHVAELLLDLAADRCDTAWPDAGVAAFAFTAPAFCGDRIVLEICAGENLLGLRAVRPDGKTCVVGELIA